MNYIQHLNRFFVAMKTDQRMTAHHCTLYMSLFFQWNINHFNNPITIIRSETMSMAKIGSNTTYVKCLNDLHNWGYIKYTPSKNPQRGSFIDMYTFDTDMYTFDRDMYTFGQCGVNVVYPSINNTNNKKQEKEHEQKKSNLNSLDMKNQNPTPAPRCSVSKVSDVPPPIEHVKIYFLEKKFSDEEAEKFFNYFQSIGWLVGGRTKMRDWKAAARNWMLNVKKFAAQKKPQPPKSQIIDKNKSYDIPL